jgi:hypothetical protein
MLLEMGGYKTRRFGSQREGWALEAVGRSRPYLFSPILRVVSSGFRTSPGPTGLARGQ